MSSPEGAIAAAPPHAAGRARPRALALSRVWPEPLALALLAGLLNFWDLARNGWANTYYSGAVRSMSASWHNFLFASFDPSGIMTVDKPPLALWVQTASVELFGFHPIAILAPQALMGVASILLIYDLTRRRFGRAAGFLAGLVLALTPIAVAISRHNNPDALLVLCSVAALWCALRALEDPRTRWFALAGVCVGLGFESKMLVALVVMPGIAAAWAWSRPPRAQGDAQADGSPLDGSPLATPRRARVRACVRARRGPLAGATAMLLVGGAWPLLVELTPAADRPWISGTGDNTVLSLIFGYNGLGRVEGQGGGPQALGGSNLFGGATGPLRLLNEALGGQAGWLLGFALVSAIAILLACRLRRTDPRSGWLLAVGGAFLTTAALFSFAQGIFHPYYVSLLAPFSAALVGAGAAQLLRSGIRARVLAALALAAGVATELAVLHDYPTELRWLTPTLIGAGALAAAVLLVGAPRLRLAALTGALALLLVAPASWALETLGHTASGTFPAGGPASSPASGFGGGRPGSAARGASGAFTAGRPRPGGFAGGPPAGGLGGPPGAAQGAPAGPPPALFGNGREGPAGIGGPGGGPLAASSPGGGPFGGTSQSLKQAVHYAKTHGGGPGAAAAQSEAATLAIAGARVAGIGGFSGRESEVSATWLAQEVRAGRIRWVLTGGRPRGGGGPGGGPGGNTIPGGRDRRGGSSRALGAVATSCKRVSAVGGLYDCAGRAALADLRSVAATGAGSRVNTRAGLP
jgi:4-amino-4-deoxy-L-arabinose transferase-like glycosyltransferase